MERKDLGASGINVEGALTILRAAPDLYRFCRRMENLPRFMTAIESVRMLDERRALWRATWGAGKHLEWETELLEDEENAVISWTAAAGSEVETSGLFRFRPAPAGRGTEVHMTFRFDLPSETFGDWLAKVFGEDPVRQVHADLRRLKQVMETGELATIDGQTRGRG